MQERLPAYRDLVRGDAHGHRVRDRLHSAVEAVHALRLWREEVSQVGVLEGNVEMQHAAAVKHDVLDVPLTASPEFTAWSISRSLLGIRQAFVGPRGNCIKIGLPGKSILKRIGLPESVFWEDLFLYNSSLISSANPLSTPLGPGSSKLGCYSVVS